VNTMELSALFPLRRVVVQTEEIRHEGGPPPTEPLLKAAALAVVGNPYAGRYEPDIEHAMDDLKPLGDYLAHRLVTVLGGPDRIEGYGKGAIVGSDGELEHGALWHVPGGYAMRRALPDALAIVPSAKKVGGPGTRLDVPITHKTASYVRGHFDAMEVGIPAGPRRDELLLVLVMSTGARIHARVGGLQPEQIEERNGLR
jgi:hypothetical protein